MKQHEKTAPPCDICVSAAALAEVQILNEENSQWLRDCSTQPVVRKCNNMWQWEDIKKCFPMLLSFQFNQFGSKLRGCWDFVWMSSLLLNKNMCVLQRKTVKWQTVCSFASSLIFHFYRTSIIKPHFMYKVAVLSIQIQWGTLSQNTKSAPYFSFPGTLIDNCCSLLSSKLWFFYQTTI